MVQNVFQRYEKKYLLNTEKYEEIRVRLSGQMQEDEYGLHTIRNIYYDTRDDVLIRTSLEKPKYKEKFRMRCYGNPLEQTSRFLEIKKKYNGVVNKRRIVMEREQVMAYLEQGQPPAERSQIFEEVDYILHHYELEPKLYLAYDRIALYGRKDPEFRITFDRNIRSRNHHLVLEDDTDTTRLLEEGWYLMEVKISSAYPRWFVTLAAEMNLISVSFSKYGAVYQRNLKQDYYEYAHIPVLSEERRHQDAVPKGTGTGRITVSI